jgi:hypothetical protein
MKHAHAGKVTEFHWARGRLFDYHIAVVLYQMCLEEPVATVTKASLLIHACMHDTSLQRSYAGSVTSHMLWVLV